MLEELLASEAGNQAANLASNSDNLSVLTKSCQQQRTKAVNRCNSLVLVASVLVLVVDVLVYYATLLSGSALYTVYLLLCTF